MSCYSLEQEFAKANVRQYALLTVTQGSQKRKTRHRVYASRLRLGTTLSGTMRDALSGQPNEAKSDKVPWESNWRIKEQRQLLVDNMGP